MELPQKVQSLIYAMLTTSYLSLRTRAPRTLRPIFGALPHQPSL